MNSNRKIAQLREQLRAEVRFKLGTVFGNKKFKKNKYFFQKTIDKQKIKVYDKHSIYGCNKKL